MTEPLTTSFSCARGDSAGLLMLPSHSVGRMGRHDHDESRAAETSDSKRCRVLRLQFKPICSRRQPITGRRRRQFATRYSKSRSCVRSTILLALIGSDEAISNAGCPDVSITCKGRASRCARMKERRELDEIPGHGQIAFRRSAFVWAGVPGAPRRTR